MVSVKLVCIGKLKEKYLTDACAEYAKRLTRYCNMSVIELPEYPIPDNPSEAQISIALSKESNEIDKACAGCYKIAMCIEGKELSSNQFSEKIDSLLTSGTSSIAFVIGSSHGLSQEQKNSADMQLSFSKMTFPHQVFRVMMMEQIYRAFSIINGSKYHK